MFKKLTGLKTKGGKEFIVVKKRTDPLYSVAFEGGGQVPSMLSGTYTDIRNAVRVIEEYLRKSDAPSNSK